MTNTGVKILHCECINIVYHSLTVKGVWFFVCLLVFFFFFMPMGKNAKTILPEACYFIFGSSHYIYILLCS